MRRGRREILLLAGLCCLGFGGCAHLGLSDGESAFASKTPEAKMPDAKTPESSSLLKEMGISIPSSPANKESLESQFALARLWERENKSQDSERIYLALLEVAPNDARLHHRLGVLAVQKGDFAKAEEHFNAAESLGPAQAELLSDIGYCYYLQHRFAEAEAKFNEALKLEPTHAAAINNLALVLGRQGRIAESLELFKRTNSEAEAYANLAYLLAQNGQFEQAEQMYLHALSLDNKMRAAAEAMLQIKDREQLQARLQQAKAPGPLAAASPAAQPDGSSPQVVRLPNTEL